MQSQSLNFVRAMLSGGGLALLLVGALVAYQSTYATPPYCAGLTLHLIGIALCVSSAAVNVPGMQRLSRQLRTELPQGEPRPARLLRIVQLVRIAPALLLVAAIVGGGWISMARLGQLASLQRAGCYGTATIISRQSLAELGGAPTGRVLYSFREEGITITGQFRASVADYPRLGTGTQMQITYLPGAPRVHILGKMTPTTLVLHTEANLLLFVIGLTYLGLPIALLETWLQRQLRLARDGIALTGTITGCKPVDRRGRRVGYRVRYELALPSGLRLTGRSRIPHLPGEPTLVGFPITVLVDPNCPGRHAPLAAIACVRFIGLSSSLLAAQT